MHEKLAWGLVALATTALIMLTTFLHGAWGQDWSKSPNHEWYKKQILTPGTMKAYGISWQSCCDAGDVCQECVAYRVQDRPPWKDGWYYIKDGEIRELPPHIVEFVPWTPTGKPVLFVAPFGYGKMKKGDPVCLKVPAGAV